MKQPSLKTLQKLVDEFNAKYSVGDKVKLRKDDESIQEVTVRYPASIMGGHSAVGWFDEISGSYCLQRVIYTS